ncbi:hypothetical protein Forpe1208_v017210 [Fusarium oxysporum f. sp. rapae]|uniref:Uncharacterized protein n=1 Tax=Fusarium oxysporum f. sp. rapae TaxID=485398 RepID=A0A8J5NF54_FUSOX|nr:hypothetical protein Forpe1208_v017210 [Fusarium oxysporum f. sp. rapae]
MKKKNRRSAFLWADEVVSKEGRKESKIWHTKVGKGEGLEQERQKAKEEEAAFMDWFREPKWTSDRVRRVLQRYSTQFSGQEINISAWRQMAIGISNRYLNKIFKGGQEDVGDFGEDDDEGEGWGGDLVNSIQDLQAGHGSHIAGLIYARLFGQGEFGTMRSREEFRKASMQWHRFFGFGAEDRVEQLGGKRFRCGFDDEREEMRRKRFGAIASDGFKGAVGTDDGTVGDIPRIAGAGDPGRSARRVADCASDTDRGRKEFNVHVAGILHARWGDGGDNAVGGVRE